MSISEEALALFEQRIAAMRGTLDSVFDTAIEVGAFDLSQTRTFLHTRFGALPEPYVWLCHCLSGGIARELNRTVRHLHTLRSELEIETVPTLAATALRGELEQLIPVRRARLDAFLRLADGYGDTLADAEVGFVDALTYWAAVMLALFHDRPTRLIESMRSDESDSSPVERLARARRTLAKWTAADRTELARILADLGVSRSLSESLQAVLGPPSVVREVDAAA